MKDSAAALFSQELDRLRTEGLYRTLRRVEGAQESSVVLEGQRRLLLCSNNYLGLANHPVLKKAASIALDRYGCGSGASRLISGTMELHQALEDRVASFKRTQASLIFNSGFQANIGIISALMGPGDLILSDALNHASIIDGCRLSRADVWIYRHRDLNQLETLLQKGMQKKKRLIVTESVFSMDGDLAPLREIVELSEKYGTLLMVDEAHGTGVFGESGGGLVEAHGLQERVPIQMGTFGKALGSFGAYVAGPSTMIELLVNRARSFIYSTSLPPTVLAASYAAIDLVEEDRLRRENLRGNTRFLSEGLVRLGLAKKEAQSPIFPIIVGEPERAVALGQKLYERGIFVQPIRPPTVPPGTSRIRLTVMATHSQGELESALKALSEVSSEMGGLSG
jgi:glycine C-acetyltransferase